MKFAPYSFSKMCTFKQCPKRFKLSYIDKIKIEQKSQALAKGSLLHYLIENNITSMSELCDYNVGDELKEQCLNIYAKFKRSDIYANIMSERHICTEMKYALDINLNHVSYNSKEALIRGAIDRITFDGEVAHIIDWKSGKVKDQKYQTYDQVALYALWLFKSDYKYNIIKCSYVYIEHNEINTIHLTREGVNRIAAEYFKLIKRIETEEHFNESTSKLCEYCEYYNDYCVIK